MRAKSFITFVVLFSLGTVSLVQACGPWMPQSYLSRNDQVFYEPPVLGFAAELRHLLSDQIRHEAIPSLNDIATAEDELREALKASGQGNVMSDQLCADFREFREQLNAAKPYLDTPKFTYYRPAVNEVKRAEALARLEVLVVPEALPKEFHVYLQGALYYYQGDVPSARLHWQALLKLPRAERQYRSVAAAFMLAKTQSDSDAFAYRQVRDLVDEGFSDAQGLAAASYGREAQVYLARSEYAPAIDLYLKQWSSGYSNAVQSLKMTAAAAWKNCSDASLTELLAEPESRAVLTAYLLTEANPDGDRHRARLLRNLPSSRSLSLDEAGRFALLEYQYNQIETARLWLDFAAPDDALALWVRSKLLLREGKIDEGRTLMLSLSEQMKDADKPDWRRLDTTRAWGELGLLMLSEARYQDAAKAFFNADSWEDCAFVLERLLTTEELVEWVQLEMEPLMNPENAYLKQSVYALCARRFMREAEFELSLQFMDQGLKPTAMRYLEAMRQASDLNRSSLERAKDYWSAARLMRDHGLALVGTELAPDHTQYRGRNSWGDLAETRAENKYQENYRINTSTWEQDKRAELTQAKPYKRFHYRYRAAQLAELAAGLLPNNDRDAARMYCVAGNWIRYHDPDAADMLYKQLVVRCPETELGQAAREVNWFPQVDLLKHQPFEM